MYYSMFVEMKNNDVRSVINYEDKDSFIKDVCSPFLSSDKSIFNGEKINKEDIKEIRIVETVTKQLGDYKLIERYIKETDCYGEKFVSEKYPGYYVKDITKEILK